MAKRPQKPKKKREQPWMEAARARLRGTAEARHEKEMSDAFMDLASPVLEGLGEGAGEGAASQVLGFVQMAWNLPIAHALPVDPSSAGAAIRAEVFDWLVGPRELRESIVPVVEARVRDFSHCGAALADVLVQWTGARNTIALRFYGDEVPASRMLDVDESGWPKASHSLLQLAVPVLDLLRVPYGDAEAQEAIGLAMAAWNLPLVDLPGAPTPEALRLATRELAEKARTLSPAWLKAFEAMVAARRTRFSYDTRVITHAAAHTKDGMINVEAAALRREVRE
jgi:hypothetical protein